MVILFVSLALALLVTGVWTFAMFVPIGVLNVLALIVVMLPLWMLHGLGVQGLGSPNNGFFVPTSHGYAVGAFLIGSLVFVACLLIGMVWKLAQKAGA